MDKFFFLNIIIALVFFVAAAPAQDKTFTVMIDPGHGGSGNPGAIGPTAKEKDINLAVALKVGKYISIAHPEVKVLFTRKTDVEVGLDERAELANKNKADLFISIHANSMPRKSKAYGRTTGTETYTLGLSKTQENLEVAMRENSVILLEEDYMQKYEGFDPNSSESYIIFEFMQNKHMEQSISLASFIQKEFAAAKRIDRGVKQGPLLVLKKTSMPAVLVEIGFISTREEERYMKSEAGQNTLAKGISNAFTKYMREQRKGIPQYNGTAKTTATAAQTAARQAEAAVEPAPKPVAEKRAATANSEEPVIYKVQVLTASKKLAAGDSKLKGYKDLGYYVDNGVYKYTYGDTTSKEEINRTWNKISKDFKGAFIVEFKGGKRIK